MGRAGADARLNARVIGRNLVEDHQFPGAQSLTDQTFASGKSDFSGVVFYRAIAGHPLDLAALVIFQIDQGVACHHHRTQGFQQGAGEFFHRIGLMHLLGDFGQAGLDPLLLFDAHLGHPEGFQGLSQVA